MAMARKVFEVELGVVGWRSSYASVQRLLDHLKRRSRSEASRVKYLQELHRFMRYVGAKSPDELVSMPKERVEELLQSFVDELADRGVSIRYVNTVLTDLKVFFKVNGFKNDRALEVERYHQPSRYRKKPEYIPTPEEIERMADSCGSSLSGLRDKAMILVLYTSGLRNSTLRALRYGDVREELESGMSVVKIPVYPEMKQVDPAACKGNIPYFTFMSPEAVEAVKKYLDERRRVYGHIPDNAPLFHSEDRKVRKELRNLTPLTKDSLAKIVKAAARRAGIPKWKDVYPHCLRKAFESALRNSGMDPDDREFLMGHILPGSRDAYYDRSKVEELRAKYARVSFFPHRQTEELRKRQIIDMAKLLGFPEDKIRRIEEILAKYRSVDEAMDEIRKLREEVTLPNGGRRYRAKMVDADELVRYVEEGWEVVCELRDGRVVVRKSLA